MRGNLDRSVDRNVAVSSMNYAYVAGGFSNTNISRIDYADDTATATPKGPLPYVLLGYGMTGNADYGYVNGGFNACLLYTSDAADE